MNNQADKLANKGRTSGRVFDISSIEIPEGWIDTAPVLCHQPLDYLTKQVVRRRVRVPASTLKFESFSDRWTVLLGNMFSVVLDLGNHIGKVWKLSVPEGLKEVLWKEMNGALVLSHRYYGNRTVKSDMGRFCLCGVEMSLGHILLGCGSYKLQPLLSILTEVLDLFSPASSFKTLHPDAWGVSPWFPLLALGELEELAFPIVKGQKKLLKALRWTRQHREWVIGNYYWALWKWRMKEIHDAKFKFMPLLCVSLLQEILLTPVPLHMVKRSSDVNVKDTDMSGPTSVPRPIVQAGDLSLLPPLVSHLLGHSARLHDMSTHLSARGKLILQALKAPGHGDGT